MVIKRGGSSSAKKTFGRGRNEPLDFTDVWYSLEDVKVYLTNGNPTDEYPSGHPDYSPDTHGTPYDGQIINVKVDDVWTQFIVDEIPGSKQANGGYPSFTMRPLNLTWEEF